MLKDTYKHKGLRKKLVQQLKGRGIEDEQLLEAFNNVPRHFFLDNAFAKEAYQDKAFPIGEGQTISQPYTVAYQTSLLEIEEGDKVLEVGTGSGYQACILSELGAEVYTIERNKKLYERTKKLLRQMGYTRIHVFFGDGRKGKKAFAPYDKILVTAAAPDIPDALIEQLKIGGVLVIPVGSKEFQNMKKITKESDNDYSIKEEGAFRFVPLQKGKDW